MQIRNVVIAGALAAAGGYALYDYYGPEATKAREMRELEKLAPDVAVPACYPRHPNAKLFAMAAYVDARKPETLATEPIRRSALKHDCIRGADNRGDVERVARAIGESGIELFAAIIDRCPVSKTDVSPSACFALDALAQVQSPKTTAVFERLVQERKVFKDLVLGAVYRLTQTPGWKTPAQMAELIPSEKEWEAKELYLEFIRSKRDAAARSALDRAFAAETDDTVKNHLQAALLELDNPGRCVVEDGGEGADGICRYFCRDQNMRLRYPKQGQKCPLVREPVPADTQLATTSAAGVAAPADK